MEDESSYQKVINEGNIKETDNQKNSSSNNNDLTDAAVRDEEEAEWDDDDFELNDFDVELKIPNTKTIKDGAVAIATEKDGSIPSRSNQDDDWLQSQRVTTPKQDDTDTTPVPSADDGGVFLTKQFQRLCTPVSKKKSRCAICTRPKQDDEKSSMYCKQCEKAQF